MLFTDTVSIYMGRTVGTDYDIQNEAGLTLIDTAIIMMVIGVLMVPFLQSRSLELKRESILETPGTINQVKDAIDAYYFETGNRHYPCPADPTISQYDPLGNPNANYGIEDRDAAYPVNAANPGQTKAYCNPALLDPTGTVYIGAVPYVELELEHDQTLDPFQNKLTYAVSAHQTDPATMTANGSVTILSKFARNSNCQTALDTNGIPFDEPNDATNVHMAIFSTGRAGQGAFNTNGNNVQACPAGANLQEDSENCDNDTIFVMDTCLRSENAGANYYDDIMVATQTSNTFTAVPSLIWDDLTDPNNMGSEIGYIGINEDSPQYEIDVSGNLFTEKVYSDPHKVGNVYAGKYCDENTNNLDCFDAASIAGDDPNMKCTGQTGMKGIQYAGTKCSDSLSMVKSSSCANGEKAIGFKSNGEVLCSS